MHLSELWPESLVIPPGIWHGFKNVSGDVAMFISYFDREYRYSDPNENKLPPNTDEIPFSFASVVVVFEYAYG